MDFFKLIGLVTKLILPSSLFNRWQVKQKEMTEEEVKRSIVASLRRSLRQSQMNRSQSKVFGKSNSMLKKQPTVRD